MEVLQFANMLGDKAFPDLKKLKYKYPEHFNGFIETLKSVYYKKLPLKDFGGNNAVYLSSYAQISLEAAKLLFTPQNDSYGMGNLEDEILFTSKIENLDFSRDSVRSIVRGNAPKNDDEMRIFGLKQGFDFIADKSNGITEENIYKLYMLTVGNFLEDDEKLREGNYYRHAPVYVVGSEIEHTGLECRKIPAYMKSLVAFANEKDKMNDLVKAAVIHFYMVYIHPYFDGNGRMARLLHLWYLILQGYESTLFLPFSQNIEKSRSKYYRAIKLVEENEKLTGVTDITPFIAYCGEYVYNKPDDTVRTDVSAQYKLLLDSGNVTLKEADLWQFVLSAYRNNEFTTKQLERDFGNAAYATIRTFVLKFTEYGLLTARHMKNKVMYKVSE